MKKYILIISIAFLSAITLKAQFIEDALRFSRTNGYATARAAGLNVAYHGISDDFAALAYNPAGLSFIGRSELTMGFDFTRNSSETNYLDRITKFKSNNESITHLGIVVPFVTGENPAAIAIGYIQESNFSDNYKFNGFNPNSSIIGFWAANGPSGNNVLDNYVYHLWLSDSDLRTPIQDSLEQTGFIQTDGGLHNIIGGAAFDLNSNVSIGFTINGKWGTFNYSREYEEFDIMNKYNHFDSVNYSNIDFKRFRMNEDLTQNISGISGSLGVMGRVQDFMRISVSVRFPTYYEFDESFGYSAEAEFDDGWTPNPYTPARSKNSYKLTTPFVYAAGVSLHAQGLTFSAGVEYTDATQLRFSDISNQTNTNERRIAFENLNRAIVQELVGQTTWGFGLEYEVPLMPVVARASYSSTTSPYTHDVAGASINQFSVGGGVYLASNLRIDGVFRWTDFTQLRSNYADEQYKYNMNPLNIGLQISYRY